MKGFCFGVALWSAASSLASAEPASDLIVGNVRDQRGTPLVGAGVAALDAAGHDVGDDVTDRAGSFAIRPHGSGVTIVVACRHCAPVRIERSGRSNIAIVVRRYFALEEAAPDAADLAALPYGRIVDALGLIPYALPSAGGSNISDRGLDGGHGLVLDDGAPIVDLATGTGALVDFPPLRRRRRPSHTATMRAGAASRSINATVRRVRGRSMPGLLRGSCSSRILASCSPRTVYRATPASSNAAPTWTSRRRLRADSYAPDSRARRSVRPTIETPRAISTSRIFRTRRLRDGTVPSQTSR
jgi:hypothetical protein